ncbi:MAG TPA: ROK family protein, partial [Longimicrobiales bacterium]
GVGIGVPGPMHMGEGGKAYVVNPRAFPGWHDIPLADWARERLAMPIFLENNATAAAVGERWYGGGRQIRTFFYIYFGSGLGGGLVLGGQPYEGFTGNAGELGYLPAVTGDAAGDEPSHVGLDFNLPRLYEKLRADGTEARTPEDLELLLSEGNPRLLAWIERASDHLTGLVLAVEYLVDPEAIFFGGRLPDRMLQTLLDGVEARLPGRHVGDGLPGPAYLLATAGADAAALGVATLPLYAAFAPAPHVLLKQGRPAPAPWAGVG